MTAIQVTKQEAAVRLGVSERTVTRRIEAGKLQTVPDANGGRQTLVVLDVDGHDRTEAVNGHNGTAQADRVELLERWNEDLRQQLRAAQDREGALIDAFRQLALPAPKPSNRPWWKLGFGRLAGA